MKKQSGHINKLLLPFSWVYGFVMFMRKKLFDCGVFKRKSYDIPIICVGNISVGGTGKTPHIEYLVRLLENKYNVAVLSRGYKRKTKGFVLATNATTYRDIGDEPFQVKSKFPGIIVAVDEDRNRGISNLLSLKNKPDIILLDDGFQHLYVKPSLSIVLIDYNHPVSEDALLPAGRLREPIHSLERANIIIVTKCPKDLKPIDMRIIHHDLNVYPYQILLYTTIEYGNLVCMFDQEDLFNKKEEPLGYLKDKKVLLVTGIAHPEKIYDEIREYTNDVTLLEFPDHHDFSAADIAKIESAYNGLNDKNAITIVTEKDSVRLINRHDLSGSLKRSLYYLPIEIVFINKDDEPTFKKYIYEHVRKNPRDSELYQD